MKRGKQTSPNASTGIQPKQALEYLANAVEDGLIVVDREYRVLFANSVMRQRVPQESQRVEGKRCYKVFEHRNTPCDTPLWRCPLSKVLQNGNSATLVHPDYKAHHEGNTAQHIKITMHPLHDQQGNIGAVAEVRRDVTAEREMESRIMRGYHQLQALGRISDAVSGLRNLDAVLNVSLNAALEIIGGAVGGILLLDEESQTLSYRVYRGLSPKYVEQMRMAVGEGIAGMVSQNGDPILVEDISQDPRAAYPDVVSTEGLKGFLSVPLKAKGEVVGVMNVASHEPGKFSTEDMYLLGSIGCQVGIAIEQAGLYERLAHQRERLRSLLQHSLTAQENERKRIARELHDETSQAITSVSLNLQALSSTAELKGITDPDFLGVLEKTQSLATHAGNEIVRLMKELRPSLLDELGLTAAINRYARNALEPHGLEVNTEFTGVDERVPSEVEVTLFRISQGAIGNILEHSEAKHTDITLECNNK
ncbi:MAG: GAF domain-containing protein, partial [Dehalococcoidia bacterium]